MQDLTLGLGLGIITISPLELEQRLIENCTIKPEVMDHTPQPVFAEVLVQDPYSERRYVHEPRIGPAGKIAAEKEAGEAALGADMLGGLVAGLAHIPAPRPPRPPAPSRTRLPAKVDHPAVSGAPAANDHTPLLFPKVDDHPVVAPGRHANDVPRQGNVVPIAPRIGQEPQAPHGEVQLDRTGSTGWNRETRQPIRNTVPVDRGTPSPAPKVTALPVGRSPAAAPRQPTPPNRPTPAALRPPAITPRPPTPPAIPPGMSLSEMREEATRARYFPTAETPVPKQPGLDWVMGAHEKSAQLGSKVQRIFTGGTWISDKQLLKPPLADTPVDKRLLAAVDVARKKFEDPVRNRTSTRSATLTDGATRTKFTTTATDPDELLIHIGIPDFDSMPAAEQQRLRTLAEGRLRPWTDEGGKYDGVPIRVQLSEALQQETEGTDPVQAP